MNNLNKNNTTPDVEDPMGSEDAKPSTGSMFWKKAKL